MCVRVVNKKLIVVDELDDPCAGAVAGSVVPKSMPGIQVACKNDWVVFECGQDVIEKLKVCSSVRKWLKVDVDDNNESLLKMKFNCSHVRVGKVCEVFCVEALVVYKNAGLRNRRRVEVDFGAMRKMENRGVVGSACVWLL